MTGLRVAVTGGSWLSAVGYGCLHDGSAPTFGPGEVVLPAREEIFDQPLARFGRLDRYAKIGCSAIALALRDAGLDDANRDRSIGIVTSSARDCTSVEMDFQASTVEGGGAFASPNMFPYTLPGVMQGECAVHFHLAGPTLCVGDDAGLGLSALRTALRMMASGDSVAMIAGWLDEPMNHLGPNAHPADGAGGALCVALELAPSAARTPVAWLCYRAGTVVLDGGREVHTLLDLFPEGK